MLGTALPALSSTWLETIVSSLSPYIMTYILLGLPSQMVDANNEWFKAIKMEFVYGDASIPGVIITKTAILLSVWSRSLTQQDWLHWKREIENKNSANH